MDTVDLSGGWDNFWTAISGGGGGLTDVLTVLGIAALVICVVIFVAQKLRGRGNAGMVLWGAGIGAVLAAPQALFPVVLELCDIVINTVLRLFG